MMDAAVNDLENMMENLDSMTQEQLQQLSDMMSQMQQLEQLMNQFPFQGSQRMGMGEAGKFSARCAASNVFSAGANAAWAIPPSSISTSCARSSAKKPTSI